MPLAPLLCASTHSTQVHQREHAPLAGGGPGLGPRAGERRVGRPRRPSRRRYSQRVGLPPAGPLYVVRAGTPTSARTYEWCACRRPPPTAIDHHHRPPSTTTCCTVLQLLPADVARRTRRLAAESLARRKPDGRAPQSRGAMPILGYLLATATLARA